MRYVVHYKQDGRWEKGTEPTLEQARALADFLSRLTFIPCVFILDPSTSRQECVKWDGERQEVAA